MRGIERKERIVKMFNGMDKRPLTYELFKDIVKRYYGNVDLRTVKGRQILKEIKEELGWK